METSLIASFMLKAITVKIMETTMKEMARQQTRHAVLVVGGKIHLIPLVKISVRTMTRSSSTPQRRTKKIASLLVNRKQNNVVTRIMVLGMEIALLPAKQAANVTIPRAQFYYGMG
jgi:hypothetical protein